MSLYAYIHICVRVLEQNPQTYPLVHEIIKGTWKNMPHFCNDDC